jgi:hypothetical protein
MAACSGCCTSAAVLLLLLTHQLAGAAASGVYTHSQHQHWQEKKETEQQPEQQQQQAHPTRCQLLKQCTSQGWIWLGRQLQLLLLLVCWGQWALGMRCAAWLQRPAWLTCTAGQAGSR